MTPQHIAVARPVRRVGGKPDPYVLQLQRENLLRHMPKRPRTSDSIPHTDQEVTP